MTRDEGGGLRPRRPRIETEPPRYETQRRLYTQLRAEIEALHRRLAETERRLAALESENERRKRAVRACSVCGRVTTRPGPDSHCPYCQTGRLERI